jgi:hypothetical protein
VQPRGRVATVLVTRDWVSRGITRFVYISRDGLAL